MRPCLADLTLVQFRSHAPTRMTLGGGPVAMRRECPSPGPLDLVREEGLGGELGNLNGMNSHVVDDTRN